MRIATRLTGVTILRNVVFLLSWYTIYCPMLGADSRFLLANNHEVYTRISRLTSSAWNVMRKKWRSRPPSTFLATAMPSSNTVFIRWFRPDKRCIWDLKDSETFQNLTNIVRVWDKFVTPCLLPRIRSFIHIEHRDTTLGLRSRWVLRRCVWINYRGN